MAEDKELYGYDEEDIITLEYDNGDEESMYDSFGSLHDPVFYRTFNNH